MHSASLAGTALATLGFATAAFAVDPYAGLSISAEARYYALVCGTCDIDTGVELSAELGGPGQTNLLINQAAPGWALAARASYGVDGLADLGGYGFSDILIDLSIPKTYFYSTSTFSQGLQRYDYLGSTDQSYSIDYTLHGSFTLGAADAASLMSAYGGLTVYASDYSPTGEFSGTVLDTDFSSARASLAGTQLFTTGGSVSFMLHPGDAIYVWSALSVVSNSSHEIIGAVDAMDTLDLHFSGGDTSQLIASIPEPGSALLWVAGLLALVLRRAVPKRGRLAP